MVAPSHVSAAAASHMSAAVASDVSACPPSLVSFIDSKQRITFHPSQQFVRQYYLPFRHTLQSEYQHANEGKLTRLAARSRSSSCVGPPKGTETSTSSLVGSAVRSSISSSLQQSKK